MSDLNAQQEEVNLSTNKDFNKTPTGFPVPQHTKLKEINELIQASDFELAEKKLAEFTSNQSIEQTWKQYFLALVAFQGNKLDKGEKFLQSCLDLRSKDSGAEELRVIGLCLKKMGWLSRRLKKYSEAYVYHHERVLLIETVGSSLELHDAYLSLDVDAYFLKKPHMSELFLKKSIQYGKKIEDTLDRKRALAMSYNNLAGTSYDLLKFDQAIDAIYHALDLWKAYEKLAGTSENRVLWAYFGVGDVFEMYASHQAKVGQDFEANRLVALESFQKALSLAKDRKLPENDLQTIKDRIKKVENMVSFAESF